MALRGLRETCSALRTPPPHLVRRPPRGWRLLPEADKQRGRAGPRWDPSPLSCQGRPESAGLRPEAGLAAATVTNWRVAIAQHRVFHLRLQIPLCLGLSPPARTRSHLEKQEVCAGSGLLAGQPWPLAQGFSDCSPEAADGVSGTSAPGLRERTPQLGAGHTGAQSATVGCMRYILGRVARPPLGPFPWAAGNERRTVPARCSLGNSQMGSVGPAPGGASPCDARSLLPSQPQC